MNGAIVCGIDGSPDSEAAPLSPQSWPIGSL
jgi:hypothetical protein